MHLANQLASLSANLPISVTMTTGPVPPVLRRLQAGAKLNLVERKVERDNNTEKQSGLHAPLEFMSICEEDKKGRRMSFWLAE